MNNKTSGKKSARGGTKKTTTGKAAPGAKKSSTKKRAAGAGASGDKKTAEKKKKKKKKQWWLRLYVAGQTPRSLTAFQNLRRICDEYLKGEYEIEVIDLLKNPQLAQGDQIVAIPTLVKNLPAPVMKIIGDLSDSERVLVGLDIKERR